MTSIVRSKDRERANQLEWERDYLKKQDVFKFTGQKRFILEHARY